ncbi:MAG TPA: phosphotransferase [Actinocrinis sp.]|jgi:aminoglycoside phosphotransferase (APT) family kinase protein
MRHGYTNRTVGDAARVEKTYQGPDAALRLAREREVLTALRGLLPVPAVRAVLPHGEDMRVLVLQFLPGSHGQELIEQGYAGEVLRACGEVLRRLHELPVDVIGAPAGTGQVLVHGDFGPNNVLLDPVSFAVTGVLDWEFAHLGDPLEDLAWCEWIVRAHHPAQRDALAEFFSGYGGGVPAWSERRAAMVERCRLLEGFCRRWEADGPGGASIADAGVRLWRERGAAAAQWAE